MQLFIMIAFQLGHAYPVDRVVDSLVYKESEECDSEG